MLFFLNLTEDEDDRRKFEHIYLTYRQTMFYASYRILKDYHLSEDAVHQAFLQILDNLHRINESNHHKTRAFLVVIVEHVSIDIYRRKRRENMASLDELELYIATDHSPETEMIDKISSAILKLPINYSTVLRLKFSQEYNDAEIAEILNITPKMITDDFLYTHIPKAEAILLSQIPKEAKLAYTFSNRFHRKMKALLKYERRTLAIRQIVHHVKAVAVVFLISLTLAFGVIMSVRAYRIRFFIYNKDFR